MRKDPFSFLNRLRRNAPDWIVDGFDEICGPQVFRPLSGRIPHSRVQADRTPPFFIVGCGRSGNTVLRTHLCNRYHVVIPPEIPGLGNSIRAFQRFRSKDWGVVVREVLAEFRRNADQTIQYPTGYSYNLYEALGIDFAAIERDLCLLGDGEQSGQVIFEAIYRAFAATRNEANALVGDKTPWNVFHLGRIARIFPNASFVHLIRNPMGAVASYVHNFSGAMQVSVRDAAYRWRDSVARWEAFRRRWPDVRATEIRFETLVEQPAETLSAVAVFLGLRQRLDNSTDLANLGDEALPHYAKAFSPIDTTPLQKWRRLLSKSEQQMVRDICGAAMVARGY